SGDLLLDCSSAPSDHRSSLMSPISFWPRPFPAMRNESTARLSFIRGVVAQPRRPLMRSELRERFSPSERDSKSKSDSKKFTVTIREQLICSQFVIAAE